LGRSPIAAAVLSFLWPGLGQWYLGRRREALVQAVPVVALAGVLLFQAADGLTALGARLLDPSFSLALLIVIAVLAVWRLLSIVDAGLRPRALRTLRRRSGLALGVLAALVLVSHAVAGYYAWSFYDAGTRIFVGSNPDGPGSYVPTPSDDYNVPPFATPAAPNDRITVLFTGIDKNVDRNHSLTDTLLIVSVDPTTGQAAMVSFPRDLAGFPMYGGGTYDGKINSLMSYAAGHRPAYPDGPLPTLAKELSYLLGIPINYYAAVDLDGFPRLIDAVGGVTVTVDKAINDTFYDWLDGSPRGFFLSAGTHKLDGRTALAFVRSRYADNDFARAARQQQLLVALQKKLTNPAMLDRLPEVLQLASQMIRTNFPAERLDEMLQLAQRVDPSMIQRVVLQPPTYSWHPPTDTTNGTYVLRLKWDAVKALSVQLYGNASTFWSATSVASPSAAP
jgi:LCP family protein required for cell wall assembly